MKQADCHDALPCPDCRALPCKHPKRKLDDCCACSGEVCGDRNCPAIELVVCEVCERGDREDELLLCDGCDHACHLSCMRPRLAAIPAMWFCQRCRAAAMEKRRRIVDAGVAAGGAPAGVWTVRPADSVLAGDDGALANGLGDAHDDGSPRFMVDAEFMRRLDENKTKLCNCKKSRCLKQYCECFREKEFCSARCNCTSCLNLPGKGRQPPASAVRARRSLLGANCTLLGCVRLPLTPRWPVVCALCVPRAVLPVLVFSSPGHRRPGEVSAGYLQETSMQLTADAGSARCDTPQPFCSRLRWGLCGLLWPENSLSPRLCRVRVCTCKRSRCLKKYTCPRPGCCATFCI